MLIKEVLEVLGTVEQTEGNDCDLVMDAELSLYIRDCMANKLEKKRKDGRGGWWNPDIAMNEKLKEMLTEHIEKGDMIDVINLSAMIMVREENGLK